MSSVSRSGSAMEYESTVTRPSKTVDGVSFTISRMSFGRRIELTRRVRDLTRKVEFLQAGDDVREKVEASWLGVEVERLYLEWGLREISGLSIDGQPASVDKLIADGPEDLSREIVAAIRAECGLGVDERKN